MCVGKTSRQRGEEMCLLAEYKLWLWISSVRNGTKWPCLKFLQQHSLISLSLSLSHTHTNTNAYTFIHTRAYLHSDNVLVCFVRLREKINKRKTKECNYGERHNIKTTFTYALVIIVTTIRCQTKRKN